MGKGLDILGLLRRKTTELSQKEADDSDSDDSDEGNVEDVIPMVKDQPPVFKGTGQKGHDADILCLVVHEKQMWTGGADGMIYMWDVGSNPARAQLAGHEAAVLAMVRDDSRSKLYSASADTTIREWTGNTCSRVFKGHSGSVTCLGLMVNDTTVRESCAFVFSGSVDGTMREWHTDWKRPGARDARVVDGVTVQEWTRPADGEDDHHQSASKDGRLGGIGAFARIWRVGVWVTAMAVNEMFLGKDDANEGQIQNRSRIFVGGADGFVRIYIYCCVAGHPMHMLQVPWDESSIISKTRRAITALHILLLEHAPPMRDDITAKKPRRIKKPPTTTPTQEQHPIKPSSGGRTTADAPTDPGGPGAMEPCDAYPPKKATTGCKCWPIVVLLYTGTADGAANVQEWKITFLGDKAHMEDSMRYYEISVEPLRRFHGHLKGIRAFDSTIVPYVVNETKWKKDKNGQLISEERTEKGDVATVSLQLDRCEPPVGLSRGTNAVSHTCHSNRVSRRCKYVSRLPATPFCCAQDDPLQPLRRPDVQGLGHHDPTWRRFRCSALEHPWP
jgi:WD40 repeat protein